MSYYQDPRNQYYNNNQSGYQGGYAGGYQQDQYYNNNQSGYQEEYVGGYQQGQLANDDYRHPNNNPYPTSTSNMRGDRAANDDDNVSVDSSIYSQPSVIGNTNTPPSNNMRHYQEQYLETSDPRRQSLSYNEYDYPPSPFADSTNTHNSTTGLTTGSGLPTNEKNFMDENHYHNSSQNTQPQFDVYKDFNNNFQGDETYDEESRHDTLTGSEGANDHAFPSNGKGNRQSTTGEHYVVNTKKGRRCAICSRKICVIITFTFLALLAVGMYFVWPRTPDVKFLEPVTVGDAEITIKPAIVKMGMELKFELDNRENWLPFKFNSLNIDVSDAANLGTFNRPIAVGNIKDFSIKGKAKTAISIPISINYEGSAPNDPVLQDFIGGCTQPKGNEKKSFLNLRIDMKMFIKGLDWVHKPTVVIPIPNFECPFNAVRPDAEQPTPPTEQPEPQADPAPVPPPAAPEPPKAPATAPAPPADPATAPAPPADPAPAPPPAATEPPTAPEPAPAPAPAPAPEAPAEVPAPGDGGAGDGGAGDGGAGN